MLRLTREEIRAQRPKGPPKQGPETAQLVGDTHVTGAGQRMTNKKPT